MVDKLEAVDRGEISRLMIFMPPRHGKSVLSTQFFPAWFLGRHPERFVITTSYSQELSEDFGRRVRNLVREPLHRAVFPAFRLAEDSTSIRQFDTTSGGCYYAVGRGGPLTGRGAHLLIIDDPLKDRAEAYSEKIRRALHEWYSSVAFTRLQPGAAVVLIQTRWHQDDLAGWLLREHASENWTVVCLPAIAQEGDCFRRPGEALWPEKFPLEALGRIRCAIGGAPWSALYQQQPSAADGQVFKRNWWRFYREQPVFRRIVHSWDTAFKAATQNDYSVCTVWGVMETGFYLLWFWRGRDEFPELKKRMRCLAEQYKPTQILIEDQASGQCLIQELRYTSSLPIVAVKVDKDKLSRALAVTPLMECGRVFLPESAPWLDDYVDELAAFPTGTHDDAVDSTTQALNYVRYKPVHEVRVIPVLL